MPLNLSKLIKESNSGVLKSKQLLAYEYWLGTNIKQDYKLAMKLWKQVAKYNEPTGSFNLAVMYYQGDGVKKNILNSFKYYSECINSKKKKYLACSFKGAIELIRDAHYQIGEKMYFKGEYKKNNSLGIRHFEKAFKHGHFHAGFLLGLFHDESQPYYYGIEKNIKKAVKYYKAVLKKYNYFPAAANLALIYGLGQGVKENYRLFNLYYKKALSIKNKLIFSRLDIQRQHTVDKLRSQLKVMARKIRKHQKIKNLKKVLVNTFGQVVKEIK